MKQKERQERSRQAIIRAAMEEFGKDDYEAVTMEQICKVHGISKGMMYHYFTNKDELFLCCVSEIFQQLWEYIREKMDDLMKEPVFESVKGYFLLRESFFKAHTKEKHIFENAVFYPPKHLAEQIQTYREPIQKENEHFLRQVISRIKLHEDIGQGKAIRYVNSIYHVFWNALEQYCQHGKYNDLYSTLAETEELLEMFLFGVAERGQVRKPK